MSTVAAAAGVESGNVQDWELLPTEVQQPVQQEAQFTEVADMETILQERDACGVSTRVQLRAEAGAWHGS